MLLSALRNDQTPFPCLKAKNWLHQSREKIHSSFFGSVGYRISCGQKQLDNLLGGKVPVKDNFYSVFFLENYNKTFQFDVSILR